METIEQVVDRVKASPWKHGHEYPQAYRVVEAGDLAIILNELERRGQRCDWCLHRDTEMDWCVAVPGIDTVYHAIPPERLCDCGGHKRRDSTDAG